MRVIFYRNCRIEFESVNGTMRTLNTPDGCTRHFPSLPDAIAWIDGFKRNCGHGDDDDIQPAVVSEARQPIGTDE